MTDYITDTFGPGGYLARSIPGYSPRPEQIELARAVDRALATGENLLGEGPTGVGKSMAYAVPAIWHATKTGARALIVTANIALQEQIVTKDLPALREALPWKFEHALAKGRGNYLCLDRFEETEADAVYGSPVAPEDLSSWREIVDWARETMTGDLSELSFEPSAALKQRFTVTSDECPGKGCSRYDECHANAARQRLEAAQIVVTNYHLLFASLVVREATEGHASVLPPFSYVVFDEAHKAADIARGFFGTRVTAGAIRWAARLLAPGAKARKKGGVEIDPALRDRLQALGDEFFERLALYRRSDEYKARLKKPDPVPSKALVEALGEAAGAYERAAQRSDIDKAARAKLRVAEKRCDALGAAVGAAMSLAADNSVYFLEEDRRGRVALVESLIKVDAKLRAMIFESEDVCAAAAVSATMTTSGGSFDFIACELGAENAIELAVPSPFDIASNALLVVPPGIDARDRGFPKRAAELVSRVVDYAGGRTLGLFTSWNALQLAAELIEREHGHRFAVYRQGQAPRTQLIRRFREETTSVLLGTESFWAGVDVPGESLSCVVMDKLPFPTPDDPVLDALEEFEANCFARHMLPRAVIAFRQGFGRLIRTTTDRGVVVCLDSRLVDKAYGKLFIKGLPTGVRVSRDLKDVQRFLASKP